jgi:hypothetical protein
MASEDGRTGSTSDAAAASASITIGSAPAFGEGNALLTQTPTKDVNKKRKPKNNMTKSNSSFISRVIVNESLSKKLTERPNDGIFAFANINRAFQWLDMSSSSKVRFAVIPINLKHPLISWAARLSDQDPFHESSLFMP